MRSDPYQDPEFKAWTQRVRDELVPMLDDSELTVSICPTDPDTVDVKFAVELGLSICMDKPIILFVPPGRTIPEHLARVADEIVEQPADAALATQRLGEAISRITERRP